MSYLALARKWRPRTFSQLVGQEHVTKALINSLNQQRLHHAYLFTGTRGVGKTSVARLLAKALNCEQGISAEPCLQCDTCQAIEQGRFIDLIEVDAASRTGVDDTRALLDNVQYAATSGRFKIYLIDEVHMLSQHSFNALLKTLEEPPEHVKFLLATTDPQKLPATVLSRCLQFNLRHLPPELINQHLQSILNEEKIHYEASAIELIAQAAKGSMRDGLSILDQAIANSDDSIQTHALKKMLGYTQQDYAIQLLQALAAGKADHLLEFSRQIAIEGGHFHYVLDEIAEHLHQIAIYQSLNGTSFLTRFTADIQDLAQQFSAEDTQLFYQIVLKGIEEIHLAPSLAIGFDMTLLRMLTFRPASDAQQPNLAWQSQKATPSIAVEQPIETVAPSAASKLPEPDLEQTPPLKKEPATTAPTAPALKAEEPQSQTERHPDDWTVILSQLGLRGLASTAVEHAEMIGKIDGQINLRVSSGHVSLFTPSITQRIEEALGKYYQQKIKLNLSSDEPVKASPAQQKQRASEQNLQQAEESLQNDSVFRQLQDNFSAKIIKNSITPIQDDL